MRGVRTSHQPESAHDVRQGPIRVGADGHDRAGDKARERGARGGPVRGDLVRGIRAVRGRDHRRDAYGQPQPDRARRFGASSRETAAPRPSRVRSRGSSPARVWSSLPRNLDEDAIMEATLDAGAENISDIGDHWELVCAPSELSNTLNALKDAGMEVLSDELAMVATTTMPVEDVGDARKVLRLIEALDDQDDVQNVWANFDIADEILEEATT